MKLPIFAILTTLCLVVVSISGCTLSNEQTYTLDESLTITITSSYRGNYSVWVPIIGAPGSKELPTLYHKMKIHFDNSIDLGNGSSFLVMTSTIKDTERGPVDSIRTFGNVTITGHYKKTSKGVGDTEKYLKYEWSPLVNGTNISIAAKATPDIMSTSMHFDLNWTARSDFCSRHSTIKGDMALDGNWTMVQGYFPPAVCT
jgi:hypothetical protein